MASLFFKRSIKSIQSFRCATLQQRYITTTKLIREKNSEAPPMKGIDYGSSERKTNLYDKIILVWAGKYKSLADVPTNIQRKTVHAAKNKVRVKLAVILSIATAVGAIISIISGKRAARRGESLYGLRPIQRNEPEKERTSKQQ